MCVHELFMLLFLFNTLCNTGRNAIFYEIDFPLQRVEITKLLYPEVKQLVVKVNDETSQLVTTLHGTMMMARKI